MTNMIAGITRTESITRNSGRRDLILNMMRRAMIPGGRLEGPIPVLIARDEQDISRMLCTLAGNPLWVKELTGSITRYIRPHSKANAAWIGKWLVEVPAYLVEDYKDRDALYQFLSRGSDRFRLSTRLPNTSDDHPRRCVFVITGTNGSKFMNDERFQVIDVSNVDCAALAGARDQIFAEALHVLRTNGEVE